MISNSAKDGLETEKVEDTLCFFFNIQTWFSIVICQSDIFFGEVSAHIFSFIVVKIHII